MKNEVEKFDPSTLMQGVKDRIKATFVGLIPDEQWEAMVNKEVADFFDPASLCTLKIKKEAKTEGWHTTYENIKVIEGQLSPFQRIVVDMCIEKTVEVLKDYLDKQMPDRWNFDKQGINEELQKIIELSIPGAVHNFFAAMAEGAVFRLRDDIRNNRIQ